LLASRRPPPPSPPLLPYATLFRSLIVQAENERDALTNKLRELENENRAHRDSQYVPVEDETANLMHADEQAQETLDQAKRIQPEDRKSTRLNSSHVSISYAVCCLK